MTVRTTHRLGLVLGTLLVAIAAPSVLASGAAAGAHRPRCGVGARVVGGYTVRLHKHRTSGVFGVYLIASQGFMSRYGSVCINIINRRQLPLVSADSGRLGSWMDIVHNHQSIFPGLGGRARLASSGIEITFSAAGTLAAIRRCPACFRLEVWPLGYRGRRPELSASL